MGVYSIGRKPQMRSAKVVIELIEVPVMVMSEVNENGADERDQGLMWKGCAQQ
jgi:hypothetical protein